jgi:hypothetical protein
MWQNLSDDTRKRIEAAGPCDLHSFRDLKPGSDCLELFVQYFTDNCDDEEARRKWGCYWWLSSKDLSSFVPNLPTPGHRRYRFRRESESKAELLGNFKSMYCPRGATPIAWPSEISGWFTTWDQLEDEEQTRRHAWNRDHFSDDEEEKAVWQAWAKAFDKLKEWEDDNPVPMEPALRFCRDDVQGWYAAFYDEIRNMHQKAVPTFASSGRAS